MKQKIVKIIMGILILTLSFGTMSLASNTGIEDNNDFMEDEYHVEGTPNTSRWSYTNSTSESLHINNGTATMTSTVTGYSGITTKIEIYFYLQKYSGGN